MFQHYALSSCAPNCALLRADLQRKASKPNNNSNNNINDSNNDNNDNNDNNNDDHNDTKPHPARGPDARGGAARPPGRPDVCLPGNVELIIQCVLSYLNLFQ